MDAQAPTFLLPKSSVILETSWIGGFLLVTKHRRSVVLTFFGVEGESE